MKHLFLINPAAGKYDHTREFQAKIQDACAGLDYQIRISQQPGDCTRLARQAAESGQEVRIYACGGDGTLNETVAGVAGYANAAVTHFPGGSGNDFIKIFSDPAAFSDLSRLLTPQESLFDLIECNSEPVLNICSMGLDARIGTQMAAYKRLPLISGSGAYLLSALVNTIRGVHEFYRVEVDGQVIEGQQTMICVCNGRWYGGGFQPVPDADPADGLLDVLLVKGVSRLAVMKLIGPYKAGHYARYPQLIRHIRTDRLRITCQRENPVNLDGELRMAQTVEIRLSPHKLRFFYPKELVWKRNPAKSRAIGSECCAI